MSEPQQPSIGDLLAQNPGASALVIIQAALPEIASALVTMAKAGSVQAAALCMKLGAPRHTAESLVARAIERASDEVLAEIADLLTDNDLELSALPER